MKRVSAATPSSRHGRAARARAPSGSRAAPAPAAPRRDQRERLEQAREVLVRALGRHAQHHAAGRRGRAARAARPPAAARRGGGRRARAAQRRPCRRRAEQVDELVAHGVRVRDHPVRAARRERDEHPHPERPETEVRLGRGPVVEVVDRRDPRERTPGGRRGAEAVQQVDPRARRRGAAAGPARPGPSRRGCDARTGTVTVGTEPAQSGPASRLTNAVMRSSGASEARAAISSRA